MQLYALCRNSANVPPLLVSRICRIIERNKHKTAEEYICQKGTSSLKDQPRRNRHREQNVFQVLKEHS